MAKNQTLSSGMFKTKLQTKYVKTNPSYVRSQNIGMFRHLK